MSKIRLIPAMLLSNGRIVKGRHFRDHEDAGSPVTTAKIYNDQMADEIVVMDIQASVINREPDLDTLAKMTERCFVPVTFGGGITSVEIAKKVLRAGADKLLINASALNEPTIITELASQFGRQAIVVAIDFISEAADAQVASHCGKNATGLHPVEWAQRAALLGAGEIVLTAVDREGCRTGPNIDISREVTMAVDVPTVIQGGVGQLQDFVEAISKTGASAVAAGRIFQFADYNLIKVRRYMQSQGIDLRVN
jgi:imidazole glycerol-phosphate synthase subunit HisF